MKCLWAPWRMQYILKAQQPGCFLCDIVRGNKDQKNLVLRRGQACLLLMNRYPYNNGHLMVAPYRHLKDLAALNKQESLEMMALATTACAALNKVMHPDGFNLGINLGTVAGAGLKDHIHFHIVPRWKGDTNFMSIIVGTKVISQALTSLWRQLRKGLA